VLLSALDQTDPSTVVAGASQKVESDEDQENASSSDDSGSAKPKGEDASTGGSDTIGSEADEDSDDINDISESRTFLAKVSSRGSSIHWLDVGQFDPQGDPAFVSQVDPHHHYGGHIVHSNPAQYYHATGYAAQAHQSALKSHQQYFFHMNRHQLPPPPQYPYVVPAQHWQYSIGQGDSTQSGVTTEDAALVDAGEAAGSRRGTPQEEGYQSTQHQQWALYYGHQGYPAEAPVHPGALLPADLHNADLYPVEVTAETEDLENKRQRVA
jgi:hypothetical protein